MTDDVPRFSRWFQRWWAALVGAVVAIGGAVIFEAAAWSIPRGLVTYRGSGASSDWYLGFAPNPMFFYLQRLGLVLMLVGIVAVAATVVVRLVQRRRDASASW